MAVFFLRHRPPRLLIPLGVALLAVSPLLRFVLFVLPALMQPDAAQGGSSPGTIIAADLVAFRGDWLDALLTRTRYAWESQTTGLAVVLFWRASGLMLIGMGLFKLGVLTGKRSRDFYGGLIAVAFGVALPITVVGLLANIATDWSNYYLGALAYQIIYWVGIVMSLGWIGIVMLVRNNEMLMRLGRPLASVGRMALTNYLMQSLICTFVFYGHGLGLYGSVERTGQLAVVFGVWALQLVLSPLWLRHFRFGPAEWLWRSLSYGEAQPLYRSTSAKPS
jgi:uncharacterized protein